MKYAVLVARLLVGLVFAVFGAGHFLGFMPPPPEPPPGLAGKFASALMESGYIHVVKALEVTGGVLLLTGLFVPLGLVLLTPVIVNIVLFEFLLMGQPGLGIVLLALAVFLIWAYRPYFQALFTVFARPAACAHSKGDATLA